MASAITGGFLDTPTRNKLLVEATRGERQAQRRGKRGAQPKAFQSGGCRVCHHDNNHEEMLICDRCNAEYHMRCLVPPLKRIPENNWYCYDCTCSTYDDGLDEMVAALPPPFASLFGTILWAQGGAGYGWWPSIVYDPRLTLGSTRNEARKYLGKRHLCFFFHCNEVPFAVLAPNKIVSWEKGLAKDYHIGKGPTAKGGSRRSDFVKALQIANLENDLPVHLRMDSLHEPSGADIDTPLSPAKKQPLSPKRKPQNKRPRTGSVRRRVAKGPSLNLSNDVVCQIYVTKKQDEPGIRRGFLLIKPDVNFATLRAEILETQEAGLLPKDWRFVHTDLGPLSMKLEERMSVLPLLRRISSSEGSSAAGFDGIKVSLIDFSDL